MRPDLVVVSAPLLDHNSGLGARPEPLDVQALITERAIEALVGPVLPRLAGIEEGWQTLVDLKQAGKIRHIAVSNFNVAEMSRAQAIAPISSLQPPYSLIRRGIEADILPYCQARQIGVIVYSPMAAGILTGAMTRARAAALPDNDWRSTNPELKEPRLSRNLALVDTLTAVGARHGGATAGAVAVAWPLRHPAVTAAIVGFRTPAQVDGILPAAALALTEEDVREIEDRAPVK